MDSFLNLKSPLVSVDWLYDNLKAENLIILDASIPIVSSNSSNKNTQHIPSALFFDLKNKFSDVSGIFPNTYPSAEQFQKEARKLGINDTSIIVVYDDKGIYSSPRAWWLFKSFGLKNVAVLNGGLPAWIANGYKVVESFANKNFEGKFVAKVNPDLMCFFDEIRKSTLDSSCIILDARSKNRFFGLESEPRQGLRSGQIPNSKNLFYKDLFQDNGLMKSQVDLKGIFKNYKLHNKRTIFSCGSGITACILALGAELAGFTNLCVYDGSWTEYGSLT